MMIYSAAQNPRGRSQKLPATEYSGQWKV